MEITGNVKRLCATEQVTEKFKKRDLILEIPGTYPQVIKFEAAQDKVSIFDGLSIGQSVNVHFNLNGREHNNNVYNTLQAWKID